MLFQPTPHKSEVVHSHLKGMRVVTNSTEVRTHILQWQHAKHSHALVPTMGNLHEGHFRLVERAQQAAAKSAVTIFVNPIQFNDKQDFVNYPKTEQADLQALERLGVDLVFIPDAQCMQTDKLRHGVSLVAGTLAQDLCGVFRPGHFNGVVTIVAKLFNIFQPNVAVFGEKDYQQLCLIRQLVSNLSFNIKVLAVETVRASDGLALSSRNNYLSQDERACAPVLYQSLSQLATSIRDGRSDFSQLASEAKETMRAVGLKPEYVEIRCAETLAVPTTQQFPLVVLAAARLGKARLIDNIRINSP